MSRASMSRASVNTEANSERSSRGRFLALPPRPLMSRTNSTSAVIPRGVSPAPSARPESVNSKSSKRSFFSMASLRSRSGRSQSLPNIFMDISAPILIDTSNAQAYDQNNHQLGDSGAGRLAGPPAYAMPQWAPIDEDEDEEEDIWGEPASPKQRVFSTPQLLSTPRASTARPRNNSYVSPSINVHGPQPQAQPPSRFSAWTEADDCSRASSPTDSVFSHVPSRCSVDSASSCATPAKSSRPVSTFFEYNPFISSVAKSGFQEIDDAALEQLSPTALDNHTQATALEDYLSDLGLM